MNVKIRIILRLAVWCVFLYMFIPDVKSLDIMYLLYEIDLVKREETIVFRV